MVILLELYVLTKTSNYVEEYEIYANIDYPDNTVLATKEQRDLLYVTIKEAGYEWDANKKELKKVIVPIFNVGDTIVEKDFYECGYGTIKDIKDGQYIFTNGSDLNINEQEGWQLVKTSTNYEEE